MGIPFRVERAIQFVLATEPSRPLKVLDFGCGDGTLVLELVRNGFDAFGFDIDPDRLKSARTRLTACGEMYRIIGPEFPVEARWSFGLILSNQVLEHVADLPAAVRQLSAVAASRAIAVHVFPTKARIFEPHLHFAGVHWVRPGRLRRWMILAACYLGGGPRWSELEHLTFQQRADRFESYLANRVYYRSTSFIAGTMRTIGGWNELGQNKSLPRMPRSLCSRALPELFFRSQILTVQAP
ncbi:class I SAM-dependent methyltransferase [Achromobacter arsenitoxydans]|uniref:class I SAM-dependent methyltransferase n=1 Tax=Achromobacter arsenitoxydans TaxID=1147684 RepID=UPI0009DABE82